MDHGVSRVAGQLAQEVVVQRAGLPVAEIVGQPVSHLPSAISAWAVLIAMAKA